MLAASTLFDLAVALKQAVVAQFAADNLAAPARRYVTGVAPVPECECLAVAWSRVYVGVPGVSESPRQVSRAITRAGVLDVYLWRCLQAIPQGEGLAVTAMPDPAVYESDASVLMGDAFVLSRGTARAKWAGELLGWDRAVQVGPVVPLATEAGIGGSTVSVTVDLS